MIIILKHSKSRCQYFRNFVDIVQRKSPTRSLSKKQFSILHLNGEGESILVYFSKALNEQE